jgi:hypothetical protein
MDIDRFFPLKSCSFTHGKISPSIAQVIDRPALAKLEDRVYPVARDADRIHGHFSCFSLAITNLPDALGILWNSGRTITYLGRKIDNFQAKHFSYDLGLTN